jgi:hypothetical protein
VIDIATAWRPFEPGLVKRFFIADQDGCYHWLGCATDRGHFILLLGDCDDAWETEAGESVDINEALAMGIVEIHELTGDELARRQRCHTEDERGVIPLSEAAIGDLFCSEW